MLADSLNAILRAADLVSPLQIPESVWEPFMTSLFLLADEHLKDAKVSAGTTAVLVLLVDNLVIQANCGDSRAILIKHKS